MWGPSLYQPRWGLLPRLATTRLVQTPLLPSPLLSCPACPPPTPTTPSVHQAPPGHHQDTSNLLDCWRYLMSERGDWGGDWWDVWHYWGVEGGSPLLSTHPPVVLLWSRASTVSVCTDTGPAHCSLLSHCTTFPPFLLLRNDQDSAHLPPPNLISILGKKVTDQLLFRKIYPIWG